MTSTFSASLLIAPIMQTSEDKATWLTDFMQHVWEHGIRLSLQPHPLGPLWENDFLLNSEIVKEEIVKNNSIQVQVQLPRYSIEGIISPSEISLEAKLSIFTALGANSFDQGTSNRAKTYDIFQEIIDIIHVLCEYAHPLFGYGHMGNFEDIDDEPFQLQLSSALVARRFPDVTQLPGKHLFFYYGNSLIPNDLLHRNNPRRLEVMTDGGVLAVLPTEVSAFEYKRADQEIDRAVRYLEEAKVQEKTILQRQEAAQRGQFMVAHARSIYLMLAKRFPVTSQYSLHLAEHGLFTCQQLDDQFGAILLAISL